MQSLTLARLAGGVSIRTPHQWHQPTRTVLVVVVVPGQVSENLMRVRLRSLYFPFLPSRSENYLEEGSWVLTVYAEPLTRHGAVYQRSSYTFGSSTRFMVEPYRYACEHIQLIIWTME